MIRDIDLRKNNWVTCFNHTFQIGVLEKTYVEDLNADEGGFPYESLEPIPLTPELLLKCGFDKRCHDGDESISWYQLDTPFVDFYTADQTKSKGYIIIECSQTEIGRCNYLHELQNIYYTLLSTELNIKL